MVPVYRVTWLGGEPTHHSILGDFPRPGVSHEVPLSRRDVECLRAAKVKKRIGASSDHEEVAAWRVERTDRQAARAVRLSGQRGVEGLPPDSEAYVIIDAVLRVAPPFDGGDELRVPLVTIPAQGGKALKPQLREAKIRATRAVSRILEKALRDVLRRYREDFKEWAAAQGLDQSFEEYHALSRGGARRKLSEVDLEALHQRRPGLSKAAWARKRGVSPSTLTRAERRLKPVQPKKSRVKT